MMQAQPTAIIRRSFTNVRALPVTAWFAIVVTVSLVAWLGAFVLMAPMDFGPGTPLDTLPVFIASWIVMLAAMMLPSELLYIATLSTIERARPAPRARHTATVGAFITGYFVAWMAYGLLAWCLDAAVRLAFDGLGWYGTGHLWAAGVLIGAALFQVSPLKSRCLKHCRSPISYFARNWRDGLRGAIAMGARHGMICVACCFALMAVMFAVGAMSLTWMALLSLFMFTEKMLSIGSKLTLPIALFLGAMGVWIAISPATAPLLKDPLIFGGALCQSKS